MFRCNIIPSIIYRSFHSTTNSWFASVTTTTIPTSTTTTTTKLTKCIKNYNGPTKRTGIIAIKKGMTAIWDQWGVRLPVTLLQLDHVYVTQVKTPQTDGYYGIQIGAVPGKPHRVGKSLVNHCKNANIPVPLRKYTEFKVSPNALINPGTIITANHYQVGQYIDVTALSIGKGFSGVMKRWGFKGQAASHGVSLTHRHPGATGACQDPGKVWKGKKMAGRHGGKQITVQNLQIVKIDHHSNILYVKGCVPGHDDQFIRVRDAIKKYGQVSGPIPTALITTDHSSNSGTDWLQKTGTDPYLQYETRP